MEFHKDDKVMLCADILWISWCCIGFFTGGNVLYLTVTLICCLIGDYIRYRKYFPYDYQYPVIPGLI